jgi:hypothetical protein
MSEQIGRVTIYGTPNEITALTAFVEEATELLGTRIDRLDLYTRERANMPIAFKREDGTVVRARGFWSDRRRQMGISKDLFGKDLDLLRDKTVGHEFVHVIFSDWLTRWHRRQLLPLITPDADGWNDMSIGDDWQGYVADPSEALACYGSAALFGWVKPAYSTLYTRRIAQADYPKTKALMLTTAP